MKVLYELVAVMWEFYSNMSLAVAGKTEENDDHRVRRPAYDGTAWPRVIG